MSEENRILPSGEPLPKEYETLSRGELKSRLTLYISELLDNNFEKLCFLIYRHDVDEQKFHRALQQGDVDGQASRVAELVIERELQKVETRKAYRKHKGKKGSGEKDRNAAI